MKEQSLQEFNPNHPELRKKFEEYIGASLGVSASLLMALPLKSRGKTSSWKIEFIEGEKRRSVVFKTVKLNGTEEKGSTLQKKELSRQYHLLKQLENTKLKVPKAFGYDESGTAVGLPCYLEEGLRGQVLYNFLKKKEKWADEIFLKSIIEIQEIKKEKLGGFQAELNTEKPAKDILADITAGFAEFPKGPMITRLLEKLPAEMPETPSPCFSNGDLNPKNFLVKDKNLSGILDFELAGFYDPVFEFLAPLFWYPLLQKRGFEESYFRRKGLNLKNLDWYRALVLSFELLNSLKDEKENQTVPHEGRNIKEECLLYLGSWVKKGTF